MPNRLKPLLASFAIVLFSLPFLASALGRLAIVWQFHQRGFGNGHRRLVEDAQSRFREVARSLPPLTVIGYLSDCPDFRESEMPADRQPDIFDSMVFLRFAVLPVVVAPCPHRDLVLGDFSDPVKADSVYRKYNLTCIRDFGNGVMLLKRESP